MFSCWEFSDAPDENEKPDGSTYQQWAWSKLNGCIERVNKHRATKYSPSEKICIDESMSKWYGLGKDWINIGLPMYVAMERKPEDGCEIQTCCDGVSRIMLRLQLVKGKKAEKEEDTNASANVVPNGTKVMLDLLRPWLKAPDLHDL
jgi:hypothetical protein